MVKFLIDESSGRRLFNYLSTKGFDVEYVGDNMAGAVDKEILEYALINNKVIVTNDKDFGELIFKLKVKSSGVILLRLADDGFSSKVKYLDYLLSNFYEKIEGNFVTITEKNIRIRKLA
ncbi:MAG: DUF5615 family PIN-like protein [Nanoarchaeota archaeon]